MFRYLRETWKELGRSIFEGERYEKNMRGISLVALLIVIVNFVTGCINLMNDYYNAAITSPLFMLVGLLILYCTHIRRNRNWAIAIASISVIIILTYETFTVTHGFPIFWTLLLPLAFSYFADVRTGIALSLYFLVLYWSIFFTPLRNILAAHYSDVIAQRFPLLYLADVVLTIYIMVQYHRTTLHEMDNARQLLESKEAADQASAAKSDFLANMSHEIRTPINAVLGMNEMILRESLQAKNLSAQDIKKIQAAFENIGIYSVDVQSAGNNLLAIINDILDISKIEANRMEIVDNEYQFSSVLNDVSNMIYFKARDKSLAFLMDVDEAIPDALYGDEVRVRQVIINVLNNAVKYTREGSVFLSVRQNRISEEDGQQILLSITVKDTGIGIRKEDMDRLFNKFERFDLKQNSTVEGTGLGLAITKRLLLMMGGNILVESEYGAGSTFTILLPQKVMSPEPLGNFRERFEKNMLESSHYEETFHAPDADILIVDDTHMNLTVVSGLLRDTGIRIDTADSGEHAIEMSEVKKYDLILMDQRMPKMDGIETMHRVKAQKDNPNRDTFFICLTADAVSGARERYISEGFTDYLTKPIDSMALEKMLMKYLPSGKVIPIHKGTRNAQEIEKRRLLEKESQESQEKEIRQDGEETENFTLLRKAGIDPAVGLRYCQQEEAFYWSLLEEYARSAEGNLRQIQNYYDTQDWKNYSILIHAVKSSSKMIGAAALSETAAKLEAASEQEQMTDIKKDHEALLRQYQAVFRAILESPSIAENGKENSGLASEEDEILEFYPGQGIVL